MPARSRAVLALVAFAAALVSGGWLLERGLSAPPPGTGVRLFDQVFAHVEQDYVDSLPVPDLYHKATVGLLSELHDPHSAYLTPQRFASLTESTTGGYSGLGLQIGVRDGGIIVVAPLPGGPAERAGLHDGDRITAVDGKPVTDVSYDDAAGLLRGAPGSVVTLTVSRAGVAEPLTFRLRRADVHVRSVRRAAMLGDDVGYVDVTIFSDSTAPELRQAVDSLRRCGMLTLVLDLRGNPGGLLDQGVGVADLFLDSGSTIVSMRGRTPSMTERFVDGARQRWPDLRLIALVDGMSASASEIVAGALQDHDRALLVGTTTYGKGSAQSVFDNLAGGGALKLTTARWFTPSGRSIARQPDDPDAADDDAAPDSTADSSAAAQPSFRTDDGREVRGGGGIVPDVVVAAADSGRAARQLWREVGADIPAFRDAVLDVALSLKASGRSFTPDFTVTPAMREALWQRLQARGVHLTRAEFDRAAPAADRVLGQAIAHYDATTEAEVRREARQDPVMVTAVELASGARSQPDLFARARQRHSAPGQTAESAAPEGEPKPR